MKYVQVNKYQYVLIDACVCNISLTEAERCRQSALVHKWSLLSDHEIPADEVDNTTPGRDQ